MAISAAMIKQLRERTNAPMMDCKKALTETDGDMDKAVEVLHKNGLASAKKRAGPVAAEIERAKSPPLTRFLYALGIRHVGEKVSADLAEAFGSLEAIENVLRFLEPRETETRKMHSLEEYGLMHVKLYEDISRHGHIATAYAYPVKVEGRYVMDPSPIPKFDNPRMHDSPALQLFGAGREKRIYAVPPHTRVESLDFEDHPFEASKADHPCGLCGAEDSYLDEVIVDDAGGRMFVCSDTDYCEGRQAAGHRGKDLGGKDAA